MERKYRLRVGELTIAVERKNIKNLHLRVGRTGNISLTAPLFVSECEIESFALSKYAWLKKHLQTAKSEDYRAFVRGGTVTVFGENYPVMFGKKSGFFGGALVLNCEEKDIERYAARELKKVLVKKIEDRLPYWEEKTGLKCACFIVRDMKTRWGTCNIQTGKICINLQLVKKNAECLDYIIVHELGHLINRYHDKRFYNYMRYNFKDYERVRKSLKE